MKNNNVLISIVTPVYGCSACLKELYSRLVATLETIGCNFEIIMVNDASPDNSWEIIKSVCKEDKRVKGINLSRNFGQHNALSAGLHHANGNFVVVMDCDLQDKPEEIIKLYNKACEGYDYVVAQRKDRSDQFIKKFTSRLFYKLFNYIVDFPADRTVANFGIYSKAVIDSVLLFKEQNRTFPFILNQVGYSSCAIEIEHNRRAYGKSKYTLRKSLKLATDILVSQSSKPLTFSIYLGFLISVLSFIYGIVLIFRYFYLDVPLGYTSIIVTILFIGGLLFANLGILGLYIGKVFNETKSRPLYIIREKTGF